MKTEITKIKIKLSNREVEFTAAEARALQAELNKLFDLEKTELQKLKEEWEKLPKKEYVPCPVYPPHPAPIIIERGPYWPQPWTIWCGTGNTTVDPNVTTYGPTTLCMNLTTSAVGTLQ